MQLNSNNSSNSLNEKVVLWFFRNAVHFIIALCVFAYCARFTFWQFKQLYSHLLAEQFVEPVKGLQLAAIVYAAVGGFVAVMIPIHYSLSLDILGKLKISKEVNENEQEEEKEENRNKYDSNRRKLMHYCHTAEIVIYCFGMFGVSVLFQETFIVFKFLEMELPELFKPVGTLMYSVFVICGVGLNLKYRHSWHVTSSHGKIHWMYYGNVFMVLVLSGFWAGLLFASDCNNLNAASSLGLVTTHYLLWLLLRAEYAPMTDLRAILKLDNDKKAMSCCCHIADSENCNVSNNSKRLN